MSKAIIPLDELSEAQRQRFKQLTTAPTLAWPTALLWLLLTVTYVCVYAWFGSGKGPLWIGTVLNTVIGYVAFSVAHDSIHRSISANARINDALGQLGVMLVQPYIDLRLFRWAHILHHRFASGPRDPDIVLHGAWWTLPIRWMLIDALYLRHALKHGDKISAPFLRRSLTMAAVFGVVLAALIWAGYGMEIFMLWFLPSRLILLVLGFSFFWLPHVPHDVTQEDNFTRATTIRQGHEWLLGPVLQYQHYHLIHHLFPTTPFYNNEKVWHLLEPQLRRKDLAVQHGFAIHPQIYPAPAH